MKQFAPFVGAPVHYRSYGTPGGEYKAECRAALVTAVGGWRTYAGDDPTDVWEDGGQRHRELRQVWEPDRISLTVFNPTGTFNNEVSFDVPADDEPGKTLLMPGTWHWPREECDH